MAQFPAMPFWFDAYYRDTQHLTYEEHGIYLHLIKLLWHAPAQRIPNDREWLERRFKEHTPQAMALIDEFCIKDRKWITQSKVMREFQYVAETSEKQRDRIKSRWNKEKDLYHGNTPEVPPSYHPHPHPHPHPHKKDKILAHQDARKTNGHNQFESLWLSYPKKKSKRTAEKAYLKAIKLTSHEKIVEALERAKQNDNRFREEQYTPYLASWLNAGGWEDELELPKGGNEPDHAAITRNMTEDERKQYTQDYMRKLREQLDADEHTKSTH